MRLKRTAFLPFIILLLASCASTNFSKRHYTDLKPIKALSDKQEMSEESVPIEKSREFYASSENQLLIESENNDLSFDEANNEYEHTQDEDCGDQLTFKSGSYIDVKILQVNQNDIVYRPCNDLEGPAFTILKSDVAQLRYQDGRLENLSSTEKPAVIEPKEEVKKDSNELTDKEKPMDPVAIAALILALTMFLWLPAIILGIISLVRQRNNPDQYRKLSKSFAWFGILFPIIIGVLLIVGIVLIILFF
jgi:hypothetical protein